MLSGVTNYKPISSKQSFKQQMPQNVKSTAAKILEQKIKKFDACIKYKMPECMEIFNSSANKIKSNYEKSMLNTKKLEAFKESMKKANNAEQVNKIFEDCAEYYNTEFVGYINEGKVHKIMSKSLEAAKECLDKLNQKVIEINEYKQKLVNTKFTQKPTDEFSSSFTEIKLDDYFARTWKKWNFDEEIKSFYETERTTFISKMNSVLLKASQMMNEMKEMLFKSRLKRDFVIKEGTLIKVDGFKEPIGLN